MMMTVLAGCFHRDPRELDSVLAEIILVLARVSLFNRFIRYYVVSDMASLKDAEAAAGEP